VLGLLIALQAVVSPYVAAAVLLTLGVLSAWRCLVDPGRSTWRLAGAVLAATVAAAALYGRNAALRSSEPDFALHTVWRDYRAGPIAVPEQWFANPHAPTTIAFSLQALIGIGLLLRLGKLGSPRGERLWRHGWLWTAVGLALTVTHGAIVGGYTIPAPHGVLLGLLPGMDLFRVPQRLGVGALIGLAVLAGIAFADVTWRLASRRRPRASRALRAALALSLVAVSAAPALNPRVHGLPRRVQPLAPWGSFEIAEAWSRPSAARAVLAEVREPVLVLDYTAFRTYGQGASDAQEMLESIGHWYPLLNGYGGYHPSEYPGRLRAGRRLPNASVLNALERSTGLTYVFVRGAADDPRMAPWWYLARRGRQGRLQLVAASDTELLFTVAR
jgi:hypothetical protein